MSIAARNAILAGGAAPGPTPAYWGLCFTAEQANSTVAMVAHGSAPSVNLLYSTDAVNWSPFVVGTTTVTLASVGDKVWLKAGSGGNTRFGTVSVNNGFSLSGLVAASGSIMSLLDGDNESLTIPGSYCFKSLFDGCDSLTAAPELPAETLASGCYMQMFRGTSLTVAPELRATTLKTSCYQSMFSNCTSLTAVEIQATSLAGLSLTLCFDACSSLTTIKVHFKKFGSGNTNTSNWVRDVAASGTFYCPTALGTNETITRGVSACPEGWTVVNTDA